MKKQPSLLTKRKREELGKLVRAIWLEWLSLNPSKSGKRPKSWSAKWSDLKEEDKEVDRLIGEKLYLKGFSNGVEWASSRW